MKEIRGQEKFVKDLIAKKYSVDSYQREYKWGKNQLKDLIDDLLSVFDEYYEEEHERPDVKTYEQYFLGPIIVSSEKDAQANIVDGQQRLTTLTLMLICLLHELEDEEQRSNLRNLIYADDFGEKSFNLNVPERTECLLGLLEEQQFVSTNKNESIRNMVDRYNQMRDKMRDELSSLSPKRTSLFVDWLTEKVCLVEITTNTSTDAYTIFETMNDRGLRLSPVEMLKGYLLMKTHSREREQANYTWRKHTDPLNDYLSDDGFFIKQWLRGRYAQELIDFKDIGSQFHRWVRNNRELLGLKTPNDFVDFINRDFAFYAKKCLDLFKVAEAFDTNPGLQCIYYLEQHDFTLQYSMLLAPLTPDDSELETQRKIRIVAAFLDILVHRRIGNFMSVAERVMRNKIFALIPKIRKKTASDLAIFLTNELDNELEQDELEGTLAREFGLHQQNGPRVHRILARLTDYVEKNSRSPSLSYDKYFENGKESYQIEHIWHNDYNDVCSEENIDSSKLTEYDFYQIRDKIGALLLLPSSHNASYGKLPYKKKRDYYQTANVLAASLHENTYKAIPDLRRFKKKSGLSFKPYEKFSIDTLNKRQELYRAIADKLWHTERLTEEANS